MLYLEGYILFVAVGSLEKMKKFVKYCLKIVVCFFFKITIMKGASVTYTKGIISTKLL